MLVGLGFLLASLLAVLLTPAYRARTVRLTTERVRAQLPVTEQELKADKDRIRAENALRIHRLESQLARFKFGAARQLVEVNRRDGLINTLNTDIEAVKSELDVAQNARNVLEQTIADRLPRVEQRLLEAKKLLFQRDREIASLAEDSQRTQRALVEAVQINAQQRTEIERLSTVIHTRAAVNRDGLADPTFDAELALRAELEALRTRSRDQASLIDRLRSGDDAHASPENHRPSANGASTDAGGSIPEVVRLQRDLMRAETALKSLKDVASAGQDEQNKINSELRLRDQKIEDLTQQIGGLQAALRAYQEEGVGDRPNSLKDSKIAMKSRLSSLNAQTEVQHETIRKLRAEVAASNERMARQAQHFMEEMRRLGAGTLPASAQLRRPATAALRRTLTQRITDAKPQLAAGAAGAVSRPVLVKSDAPLADAAKNEPAKAELASSEVAKSEPIKSEPIKPESMKSEPAKLEVVKASTAPPAAATNTDAAMAEPAKLAAVPAEPLAAVHSPPVTAPASVRESTDIAASTANGHAVAEPALAPALPTVLEAAAPPVPKRTRLLDRIKDYNKG